MDTLELDLKFEKLSIRINGKINPNNLWSGVAKLKGNPDYDEGFAVDCIDLDGTIIDPRGFSADSVIARAIADVLTDPKTPCGEYAVNKWAENVERQRDGEALDYSEAAE